MVVPDLMPFAVQQACPAIQSSMNRAINFFTSLRLAELAVGDASLCPLGQELHRSATCKHQYGALASLRVQRKNASCQDLEDATC